MDGANFAAFGDGGFRSELAHLVFRSLGWLLFLLLLILNGGVAAPWGPGYALETGNEHKILHDGNLSTVWQEDPTVPSTAAWMVVAAVCSLFVSLKCGVSLQA